MEPGKDKFGEEVHINLAPRTDIDYSIKQCSPGANCFPMQRALGHCGPYGFRSRQYASPGGHIREVVYHSGIDEQVRTCPFCGCGITPARF